MARITVLDMVTALCGWAPYTEIEIHVDLGLRPDNDETNIPHAPMDVEWDGPEDLLQLSEDGDKLFVNAAPRPRDDQEEKMSHTVEGQDPWTLLNPRESKEVYELLRGWIDVNMYPTPQSRCAECFGEGKHEEGCRAVTIMGLYDKMYDPHVDYCNTDDAGEE